MIASGGITGGSSSGGEPGCLELLLLPGFFMFMLLGILAGLIITGPGPSRELIVLILTVGPFIGILVWFITVWLVGKLEGEW